MDTFYLQVDLGPADDMPADVADLGDATLTPIDVADMLRKAADVLDRMGDRWQPTAGLRSRYLKDTFGNTVGDWSVVGE